MPGVWHRLTARHLAARSIHAAGLANVLWAMAKMNPGGLLRGDDSSGAHAIRLCRAVLLESRPRLASFQPQDSGARACTSFVSQRHQRYDRKYG